MFACIPAVNNTYRVLTVLGILHLIYITVQFNKQRKQVNNGTLSAYVFHPGIALLMFTISAFFFTLFLPDTSCGYNYGISIGNELFLLLFWVSTFSQLGTLLLLGYLRLYNAFQNSKLSEYSLSKCTQIIFIFMHTLYWILITARLITDSISINQDETKSVESWRSIWSGLFFPLFTVLQFATAILFCYKMCSLLRSLKDLTGDAELGQDLVNLNNKVKRFVTLFGISIIMSIVSGVTITSMNRESNKYYIGLFVGWIDIYTNAICTMLTYKEVNIIPFRDRIYNVFDCERRKLMEYQNENIPSKNTNSDANVIHIETDDHGGNLSQINKTTMTSIDVHEIRIQRPMGSQDTSNTVMMNMNVVTHS